jgi:hypothetical protein
VDQNGSLSTKGRLTRPTGPGDWWETFYLLLNHLVSLPREQVGGQGFFFTFAECDFPETEIGADAIALPKQVLILDHKESCPCSTIDHFSHKSLGICPKLAKKWRQYRQL